MQDNWEQTHFNLEITKQNVPQIITYKATGTFNVTHMSSSCGCSVPEWDAKTRELIVRYNGVSVPRQVIGTMTATQTIKVTYQNGGQEILTFTANIER